jgi:hypothetical protein
MALRQPDDLSPQQHRFAEERGATLGARARVSGQSVFVYRDEGWRTCRWLVDPAGNVVDFATMRRAPRATRFARDTGENAVPSSEQLPAWPSQTRAGAVASQ